MERHLIKLKRLVTLPEQKQKVVHSVFSLSSDSTQLLHLYTLKS